MTHVLALGLVLLVFDQARGSAPVQCPGSDAVGYSAPNPSLPGSVTVEVLGPGAKAAVRGTPHKSPYGTASFRVREPRANGPMVADTVVEVVGNNARPLHLQITLARYEIGVQVKWLNEKLLWIQMWRGRIVSTDAILDVETGQFVYEEDANYGSFIVPCHMKPTTRTTR